MKVTGGEWRLQNEILSWSPFVGRSVCKNYSLSLMSMTLCGYLSGTSLRLKVFTRYRYIDFTLEIINESDTGERRI